MESALRTPFSEPFHLPSNRLLLRLLNHLSPLLYSLLSSLSSHLISSHLISSRLDSSRLVSSPLISFYLISSHLIPSRLISSHLILPQFLSTILLLLALLRLSYLHGLLASVPAITASFPKVSDRLTTIGIVRVMEERSAAAVAAAVEAAATATVVAKKGLRRRNDTISASEYRSINFNRSFDIARSMMQEQSSASLRLRSGETRSTCTIHPHIFYVL